MTGKAYLGDGVYIDVDNAGRIILTTEDGVRITNRIYLEPGVFHTLVGYVEQLGIRRGIESNG